MALYDTGGSVSDRIATFYQDVKQAGKDRQHAVTIATVSINESGATFRVKKPDTGILPVACFRSRPIIALEVGNPALDGIVSESNRRLPASWLDDPEVRSFADQNGWIGQGLQATAAFSRYDSLNSPNNEMPRMIEFLIMKRKREALKVFSIGPTQLSLKYHLPDWDKLWQFYIAESAVEQWDSGAWNYLLDNFRLTKTLKQCGVAENGCLELWLQNHQTGSLPWGEERWRNYVASFAKNRDLAFRIADSVWPE
jgi:hypothetical protein